MPIVRRAVLFATALLVGGAPSAQPGWVQLEGSPYNDYRTEDLWFVDADHGWGVDGDGRVFRTTDSGAAWAQVHTLDPYLRSTTFVSRTKGWVGTIGTSGRTEKLYETLDGGLSFTDISDRITPGTHGICSLFAVSEDVVYGAGTYEGPATLIKTVDGGASWDAVRLWPLLDTAIDVHFFDEQRGLVVGGTGPYLGGATRPRVIGTEDGGATWTVRHTVEVAPGWGWKLSFPTPEIGYMAVEKYDGSPVSYVLKTVDGGESWAELRFPGGGGNMQGVGFLTPEIGWVSGRGVTSQTVDGGETWTTLARAGQLDTNVNRFFFLDNGLGFASGHRIHRLDARATLAEVGPEPGGLRGVGPNPARDRVHIRYRPTAPLPATVHVFDALGREVGRVEDPMGDGATTWAVPEGLAPGAYIVRLRTAEGEWALPVAIAR